MTSRKSSPTNRLDYKQSHQIEVSEDCRSHEVITAPNPWQWIIDQLNVVVPAIQADEQQKTDEERLEKIFNNLDRSGNGRIDIQDLSAALKASGMSDKYAEVSVTYEPCCMLRIDNDFQISVFFLCDQNRLEWFQLGSA